MRRGAAANPIEDRAGARRHRIRMSCGACKPALLHQCNKIGPNVAEFGRKACVPPARLCTIIPTSRQRGE